MSEMNDLRTDFRTTLRRLSDKEIVTSEFSNRIEIEFDKVRMDFRKLKELTAKNAPIEIIKEFYDRLQNSLMRLMEYKMPLRMNEAVKDMLNEADGIIAKHMRDEIK
jgi:hypothetical protein